MDGMSLSSRVRIIVVPSDAIVDVMANTGVAREMIRTQRINMLIFLIEQM